MFFLRSNSNDTIIIDGKKYTITEVIQDVGVDSILFYYNRKHPKVLEKSLKLFSSLEYKNFSIEQSHICLYGVAHDFNLSAKIEDTNLRTYTLWHYDKVEINLTNKECLYNIDYTTEFIPQKIRHQPFKTYYVNLNLHHFLGFFVSYGFYSEDEEFNPSSNLTHSNELFLSLVFYNDNNEIFHANFPINLTQSGDLTHILRNAWYNFMELTPLQVNQSSKDALDNLVEIAVFAINTMYYINELNGEKPQIFQKITNIHKHNSNNKSPKCVESPVEYKRPLITSELSMTRVIDIHVNMGGTKAPHIRKGHWHTYWVGKKGTANYRSVLKWVEETTVNCGRNKLPNIKITL